MYKFCFALILGEYSSHRRALALGAFSGNLKVPDPRQNSNETVWRLSTSPFETVVSLNGTGEAMILIDRELPKIGGSRGGEQPIQYLFGVSFISQNILGFVALIVCMGVLVVGLCAAIFILLRDHEPTDEERAIRRRISQRHREQQSGSPSSFTYSSFSTSAPTLTQKIWGIFGVGSDDNNKENGGRKINHRNRGGQGWVQAGFGDDWDSDRETHPRALPDSAAQSQRDVGEAHGIRLTDRSISKDGGPVDLPFQLPQPRYSQAGSTSSFRSLYDLASYDFDASSSWKPPASHMAPTRLPTSEFLTPPSPSSVSVSPSPTPLRATSSGPHMITGDVFHTDGRHFSTQSGSGSVSVRTLHTGTKFIESLE